MPSPDVDEVEGVADLWFGPDDALDRVAAGGELYAPVLAGSRRLPTDAAPARG